MSPEIPIDLPPGWSAERVEPFGIVLHSIDGFVTVDEKRRNYALGIAVVPACGQYHGRRWRERLYADAIAALQAAEA